MNKTIDDIYNDCRKIAIGIETAFFVKLNQNCAYEILTKYKDRCKLLYSSLKSDENF